MAEKEIFSGENSRRFWEELNALNATSTIDDVRDVLYYLCCKLQELETRLEKQELK